MKKKIILLALVLCMGAGAQIVRSNLNITLQPTADGWWTRYRNFAAEEWRTDTPERDKTWKILGEYPLDKHQFLWYFDGRFRNAAGSVQATPSRWAYLRLKEDRFDGKSWKLPDGTATMPAKIPLDATILQLREAYTKKQVMDAMDKFVWADGVGAPEK